MLRSTEIDKIAPALVAIQREIKVAKKTEENPHFKKSYAGLVQVWDACREALAKYEVAVVQMPVASTVGVGLGTYLIHSSGQYVGEVAHSPIAKNDPQGIGSGLTYLRRYALCGMLGIVADEDDDGAAASSQSTVKIDPSRKPPTMAVNGAKKKGDL